MFTLQSSPYRSPTCLRRSSIINHRCRGCNIRPWVVLTTFCCACAEVTVTPHVVRNVVPNVTDLLRTEIVIAAAWKRKPIEIETAPLLLLPNNNTQVAFALRSSKRP